MARVGQGRLPAVARAAFDRRQAEHNAVPDNPGDPPQLPWALAPPYLKAHWLEKVRKANEGEAQDLPARSAAAIEEALAEEEARGRLNRG